MANRKPPRSVYGHSVTLRVCTGTDVWQKPIWVSYNVTGVHMQPARETRRTANNTEVALKSMLFVDSVYSAPSLDWDSLQTSSENAGAQMQVEWRGQTYTVNGVERLEDELCVLDHFEVDLA